MSLNLVSRLLFEELGPDNQPLFKGISELAGRIATYSSYRGKAKSVAAFLGQILRNDRPCPEALSEAIQQASRDRLSKQPQQVREEWAQRIRRALELSGNTQPLSAELLYAEVQDWAETASEHYIITSRPAEVILFSTKAESLRETLLHRLGLLDLISQTDTKPEARETDTRYTFCLPSTEAGHRWWDSVFVELKSKSQLKGFKFEEEAVVAALKELDRKELLRVYSIPSIACGCPVVVFDPNDPVPKGYNLYYYPDNDLVSVSRMDKQYLQDWKELVYQPLEAGRFTRTRINYTPPKPQL